MPELIRPDGAVIRYEISGQGHPVLALAPGGVSSEPGRWALSDLGDITPLTDQFTLVNMSQRYAGASRAPLTAYSYDDAVGDQLAVLDAAGIKRAHVLGAGHGANWALRMAYDAPARVGAVCLVDPVGIDPANHINDFYRLFNETIRTARAYGLEGVIAAAKENGCFVENPAAGPWAQRLHDEPSFRGTLESLGRELYITLVVDFRDGLYPVGRRFFALNDVAVERIGAPMLVFPGQLPGVAAAICAQAANSREADVADGKVLDQIRMFFIEHG